MTDVPILHMVKCPMLFEHEPCDLIPSKDCYDCKHLRTVFRGIVDCSWEDA
jgi:hypothetical protein